MHRNLHTDQYHRARYQLAKAYAHMGDWKVSDDGAVAVRTCSTCVCLAFSRLSHPALPAGRHSAPSFRSTHTNAQHFIKIAGDLGAAGDGDGPCGQRQAAQGLRYLSDDDQGIQAHPEGVEQAQEQTTRCVQQALDEQSSLLVIF